MLPLARVGQPGLAPGLAVSQSVKDFGVEGQGWDEMLAGQRWSSAAEIAVEVAKAMLDDPPPDAGVLNLNVPNLAVEDMRGWRWTEIGQSPLDGCPLRIGDLGATGDGDQSPHGRPSGKFCPVMRA